MTIVITEVIDFFATNVRMGSTILSILTMSSLREVPRDLVHGLAQSEESRFLLTRTSLARRHERPPMSRATWCSQSSYGCDLVAVFEGRVTAIGPGSDVS